QYYWIEAHGHIEKSADGREIHFPGVLLDIEQRRTLERERDRATAMLRTIMEAVPGVVYAKDREGRMLIANGGTTKLLGLPPERYLGRTDLENLEDKDQARAVMANDRRIMESGVAEQVEEAVRLADGEPAIWLSTKAPLRDETGEVIGLVGASVDISGRIRAEEELRRLNQTLGERVAHAVAEREQAEAALRQAQKMEAVGQLTGGIAHDFNNLLTIITGNVEMAVRALEKVGNADARLYRMLGNAMVGANRAAALTQRLLAFSRRQPLAPKPVDIARLVDGMSDLMTRSLGETIRLDRVMAPDLWCVEVDPNQLESALLNLAVNARDAMPQGGTLTMEAANITLDEEAARKGGLQAGAYVALAVTDTGTGMSRDTALHAFEPFFTTKEQGKGTGLGLSMVYGFVRQSGGHVKIRSEEGQGTTVKIYLPRLVGAALAEDGQRSNALQDAPPARGTILVTEDDPDVRSYAVECLRELGYDVLEAHDAASALAIIQGEPGRIDLLLTDVVMPGDSGRDLADRALAADPALRVVFMSGYPRDAIVHDGKLDPGVELIAKPFTSMVLGEKMRDMLRD
ncbi:MAG: PAS domain-containing protein, partial [Sphingobium sp.]